MIAPEQLWIDREGTSNFSQIFLVFPSNWTLSLLSKGSQLSLPSCRSIHSVVF
jgi:hypothetical protein